MISPHGIAVKRGVAHNTPIVPKQVSSPAPPTTYRRDKMKQAFKTATMPQMRCGTCGAAIIGQHKCKPIKFRLKGWGV